MAQLYDDPQRSATAESTLHALQQGRRPVEDYVAEFPKLACNTGGNDAALWHQFRLGLSKGLKDKHARVGIPGSLDGPIGLTIQLDRRFRERRRKRDRGTRPTWTLSQAPSTPTPTVSGIEPMQLEFLRSLLTIEERLRRHQNTLCLY